VKITEDYLNNKDFSLVIFDDVNLLLMGSYVRL
jgi:hypothetical protein